MNKRKAARTKRRAEREHKRWVKERAHLIMLLRCFVRSHYGNPATGRMGSILDGPDIAAQATATALLALLTVNRTELGADGGGHHGREEAPA
jgi:hypothetical protein